MEVKRFETGIWRKGGWFSNCRELQISNCTNGYKLMGDPVSGTTGAEAAFNVWYGGRVEQSGRNSYPPRPHAQKCAVRSRLPPLQGKAGLTSAT